ncbi:MAG: ribulokinase [Acidobacteria bacterium]|nr:ribulokinase [Acidobacteriota bacterium]MBI3488624.1 ribulokinase [Acidobacteriota bacterium]
MTIYAIGLDFGTNSCRALLVDLHTGEEKATEVFNYPSGQAGIITHPKDPHLARQNASDYLLGIETTVRSVLAQAQDRDPAFDAAYVVGLGIDTTGSSPMPIDDQGNPLSLDPRFKENPAACVWLWRDHTSFEEAGQITELAARIRPQYLAQVGGTYSSEWFWSKILHCRRAAPDVFDAAATWVEICDWLPAVLTGNQRPDKIVRGICSAGHKAMFNPKWGGLPDADFLGQLDPALATLRSRLFSEAHPADHLAGGLCPEWAARLGLRAGVAVAAGAFDAHMGAVGAGVAEGSLVKIMGTSTCDIMVWPNGQPLADIPGVCGIVDGSVVPGYFGIEAGQSAVGDLFLWFVRNLAPDSLGADLDAKFKTLGELASQQAPGESGLLALDWNNGNRTVLVDARLTGLLLGQTLHTQPHEIYRALIEATAFGALTIIERIEEYGVPIREVVNCGGLAAKNAFLMQTYADITGRPMKIARSEQTPALGAALFGAMAAGAFPSIRKAQERLCGIRKVYQPNPEAHAVYRRLYQLYRQLHDGFGTPSWNGSMANVMKELLTIRDQQCQRQEQA